MFSVESLKLGRGTLPYKLTDVGHGSNTVHEPFFGIVIIVITATRYFSMGRFFHMFVRKVTRH